MIRCSMIGGPVGPARTGIQERHSHVDGFGKVHPPVTAACKLGKVHVQWSARSYNSLDSIGIPFRLRELGKSGSDFNPVLLQPGQLSRTSTEGEADGWILTPSTNGAALRASSLAGTTHLAGEVEVANGIVTIGNAESLTTNVEDAGAGVKADFFQGIKDVFKRAETSKEEVTPLDLGVSPTPYTPTEGPDAVKFALLSVTLLFIFWLGNFYVPDLIFKRTVFKKPDEPDGPNVKASDAKPSEDSTGASKGKTEESERSSSTVGTGFGRSKERRFKSSKRK